MGGSAIQSASGRRFSCCAACQRGLNAARGSILLRVGVNVVDYYLITEDSIDITEALTMIDDPATGAQAIFLGTVRDEYEGRKSLGLYYDAYPTMAQTHLKKIGEAMKQEFAISHVVIIHRIGELPVGAASVLVAVSAAHREAAFAAAKAGIDRVKSEVPIWKKEHWADGSSEWHDHPDHSGNVE